MRSKVSVNKSKSVIEAEEVLISIHSSIEDIVTDWDAVSNHDVFLHSDYLRTVERFPPKGLRPYYLLIRDSSGVILGKVYIQSKKFKAQESLTITRKTDCPSFFSALGFYLKEHVARKVEFGAIACGNLMVSGEHGFFFAEGVEPSRQHLLVELTIKELIAHLAKRGDDISIVLLKDFAEGSGFSRDSGIGPELYSFKVQPNMILEIRDHWQGFDDYLKDMSSKYRVRYKRALKKLDGIEVRSISSEELDVLKGRMFQLYQNIANSAGFNLFILSPDYIPELARNLGDKVKITGYFRMGELVGYTTLITNNEELEAHFLGFDTTINIECQLYLNMLYYMARTAIDGGFKRLNYSRTALEIKSSVGAVPEPLNLYIRHQKSVQNRFLPKLFEFLSPVEEWVQRHPFKV